ncbi:YitT family protein [Ammoniphilus resinae]|nr:YitT family protein [Ammoniphilus resinae]
MPLLDKAIAIIIGSIIISIGINFFLVPFELLDGGIIGLGLIVKYLLGIKAGLTIIVLSIPIFTIAWFKYRNYFLNSLHGMFISSFMIDLLYPLHDLFLSYFDLPALVCSVIGGILVGLGIGIMLRYEVSTGGTDLLAQFLANIFRLNVGIMIFIIDALVICVGGLLISKETFFLSVVTITFVGLTTSICTWRTT